MRGDGAERGPEAGGADSQDEGRLGRREPRASHLLQLVVVLEEAGREGARDVVELDQVELP